VPKIEVTRSIENGKSKYYVNGKTETVEKVRSLFCSVKLNVNNPHFLIMQGRVTKVINMKPKEVLGLIEEAAGISLYQSKKEQTLALIKKKDNKLIEIDKILTEEVNPQLDVLRKEKNDYSLFKSNENMLEENEKVLTAYEYFENNKIASKGDELKREVNSRINKIESDIKAKEAELEIIKKQIKKIECENTGGTKEKELLNDINQEEKSKLEAEYDRDRVLKEKTQFVKVKANMQREIAIAESEVEKTTRELEELVGESIPQYETEL
jgi:structural maintenance of chromosome 2